MRSTDYQTPFWLCQNVPGVICTSKRLKPERTRTSTSTRQNQTEPCLLTSLPAAIPCLIPLVLVLTGRAPLLQSPSASHTKPDPESPINLHCIVSYMLGKLRPGPFISWSIFVVPSLEGGGVKQPASTYIQCSRGQETLNFFFPSNISRMFVALSLPTDTHRFPRVVLRSILISPCQRVSLVLRLVSHQPAAPASNGCISASVSLPRFPSLVPSCLSVSSHLFGPDS